MLIVTPIILHAQSNFKEQNNGIVLEKTFRSSGKTESEIFDDAKKAIYEEYKISKSIINEDKSLGYILANGKVDYSNSGFNKQDREAEFNLSVTVKDDVYTLKFFDFVGRLKKRANFQFDYGKEYRSLYVLESSSKRSARRKQFEAFENAIMESMSNITSKIGVSEVIK